MIMISRESRTSFLDESSFDSYIASIKPPEKGAREEHDDAREALGFVHCG